MAIWDTLPRVRKKNLGGTESRAGKHVRQKIEERTAKCPVAEGAVFENEETQRKR